MSERRQADGFLVPRSKNMELVSSNKEEKVVIKEGKKEVILEEDEHIKNLEKILNRDFFPVLHFVSNQENDIERDFSTNLSTAETGIENPEIDNLSLNQYVAKYNRYEASLFWLSI